MVIRYRLGVFFLLLCLFQACVSYVPYRIRKNFKYCYDPNVNYSQTKIKLNGYYFIKNNPYIVEYPDADGNIKRVINDTTFNNIMFFQDGVFVMGDTRSDRQFYDMEYLKDVEQKIQPYHDQFYDWYYWGLYQIYGDTIKMQFISHQPFLNPYWVLIEVWYKMNEENTLSVVYAENYTHDNTKSSLNEVVFLEFVETNIILPSDSWLKKNEWFWCDKEKFRAWKRSNK